MVRTRESLGFDELDFAIEVEGIDEVAFRENDLIDRQLGFSLRKSVKRIGSKVKERTSRVVKKVKKGAKSVGKKVKEVAKRVGRKAKKAFVKAAPVLGIVAQALNFVVPGLGVAVGLAINVGAQAIAAHDAKKAYEKAEKEATAAERAELEAARKEAEEALTELGPEADKATMDAFIKGEAYFAKKYGITREQFQSLPLNGRYQFLMGSVYDLNIDKFMAKGVTREQFLAMPVESQTKLLEMINAESGIVTTEQAIALMEGGSFPWMTAALVGGGALVVFAIILLLTRGKKKK